MENQHLDTKFGFKEFNYENNIPDGYNDYPTSITNYQKEVRNFLNSSDLQ